MKYCITCGAQLHEDSEFCHKCGAKVGRSDSARTKGSRRTVYEGTIHKCPNCGNTVNPFEIKCTWCGHVFRDSPASEALKRFNERYSDAWGLEAKIDVIRACDVPYTREDILGFLALAEAHVDFNSYLSKDLEGRDQSRLTDAWKSLYERVLCMAQICIPEGDPYKSQVQEIENRLQNKQWVYEGMVQRARNEKIRREKWEEKQQRRRAKDRERLATAKERMENRGLLIDAFVIVGMMVLLMVITFLPGKLQDRKLEKQVDEIEELIEDGNYSKALRMADRLIYDGDDKDTKKKWQNTKNSLIQRIGEAEARSLGKARIPTGKFTGGDFSKAVNAFKAAGFTDVTAQKKADLITGWINHEGEVIEVLVDGSTKYNGGEYVDKDVKVVVRYHAFK